ncbi:MAG TPA: hypothetical protein VJC10_02075 [Patescibacteria group bacterium]|nr:hypothetical protein [Patescibacteria group bacterium]
MDAIVNSSDDTKIPKQQVGSSIKIQKSKTSLLVGIVLLLILVMVILGYFIFASNGTIPSLNVKNITNTSESIVDKWDPTQSKNEKKFAVELPIDTKSESVSSALVIYTISGRINDIQTAPNNDDIHIVELISSSGIIQDFQFQVDTKETPISLTKKATNETTNIPFNNLEIGDPVDLNFTINLKKDTSSGLVTHIIKYE